MFMKRLVIAFAALLLASSAAQATDPTTIVDQNPAPAPTQTVNPELITQSIAVTGGTLYVSTLSQSRNYGGNGQPQAVAQTFVPVAAGGLTRYLPLMLGRTDTGLVMTATPGTGVFGISRTAGTSLVLTGEAANSSTVTDKVVFEFSLPDTYVAGANIAFVVNGAIAGASCSLTTASTLLTPTLYTEVNGVEAAVTTSAAQKWAKAQADYTFTVTGTGLVPGQHVAFEIIAAVTAANSNNCTGAINSVKYGA